MKYRLLFVSAGVFLAASLPVLAAPAVKGITVSPAIIQISLSRNQTAATFAGQVTNNTKSAVVLGISAEDFTSLNQTGGISFLTGKAGSGNPHGLAGSLVIGNPQVALGPGQSQMIPITVQSADKLATGGHYAALTYQLKSVTNPKGNSVAVDQTVSSLIFLTTYGQGTQTTDLTTPVVGSFATALPQNLNIVFGNAGNTQTTPRGLVQILDPAGNVVSQATINVDSGLILPQSERLFNLALTTQGRPRHPRPGLYTLRVMYRHDGQPTYAVYEQRFLFINLPLLVGIIGVLVLVAVLLARKFLPETLLYRLKSKP